MPAVGNVRSKAGPVGPNAATPKPTVAKCSARLGKAAYRKGHHVHRCYARNRDDLERQRSECLGNDDPNVPFFDQSPTECPQPRHADRDFAVFCFGKPEDA
jgi:hypothetical protein